MGSVPDYLVSQIDADNLESLIQILCVDGMPGTVGPPVLFLGSGLSCECGYASWETLAARLCDAARIRWDSVNADSPSRARLLLQRLDEARPSYQKDHGATAPGKWRLDTARFLVEDKALDFSDSHVAVLKANFSEFVTTNFDPCLALAGRRAGVELAVVPYDPARSLRRPLTPGRRFVYHVHGRLWDEDGTNTTDHVVLLSSEYDQAYGRDGPLREFLRPLFGNYNVVVLGSRLEDPDLFELVDRCADEEARRMLAQERTAPGGRDRWAGPLWFRIEGIPEDDDIAAVEMSCRLQHSNGGPFRLIHYKYSRTERGPRWGLAKLLDEIAHRCPFNPHAGGIPPTARAEPSAAVLPDLTPATAPARGAETPTQVMRIAPDALMDFNERLRRVEEILKRGP